MESRTLLGYDFESDPNEEQLSVALQQTINRSRASSDKDFLAIVKKLDTFSRHIRKVIVPLIAREDYKVVTTYLQNRVDSVPKLAKRYHISEYEVQQALDVIELIRQA